MKWTMIIVSPTLPHIDTDTSKIRSLSQESSKGEPEWAQDSEAVCKLLPWLPRILPLVGGEPGQHVQAEGGHHEHQHGVEVDLVNAD